MSLRDQLVAKGLVSKKDAKKVERELKDQRRHDQGHKERKSRLAAQDAAEKAAQKAEVEAQRLAERKEREDAREALETALRVKHLLLGNRRRAGTGQPFWHHSFGGTHLLRLDVASGTAFQLRCGELAIGALPRGGDVDYLVIPRATAEKLLTFAAAHVVFYNADDTGLSAPDLQFLRRDWDTSLRPHRAAP